MLAVADAPEREKKGGEPMQRMLLVLLAVAVLLMAAAIPVSAQTHSHTPCEIYLEKAKAPDDVSGPCP